MAVAPALDPTIVKWVFETLFVAFDGKISPDKVGKAPSFFESLYKLAARDRNVMSLNTEIILRIITNFMSI